MKDITIICQENGFRESVDLQALNRTNPTFEDLAFNLAAKFNSIRSLLKAGVKFAYINQNGEMQNVSTNEQINSFSAKAGYTFYLQSGNVQTNNAIQPNTSDKFGTFIDQRDGKVYKTVKIGNQVWMAENLAYMPHINSAIDKRGIWVYEYYGKKMKTGFLKSKTILDVKDAIQSINFKKYGCLYDWETACNISPKGWHLPSIKEFSTLIEFLGGTSVAGEKLKTANNWKPSNRNFPNNESGFTALPGGCKYISFQNEGNICNWWSSSLKENNNAWSLFIGFDWGGADYFSKNLFDGLSIRCLKDTNFL